MSGAKVKVVVYVPVQNADVVRDAMAAAGAGKIGNYSSCSFSVIGKGRFLPLDGANPTIGTVGKLEEVEEERIEITCEKETLTDILEAMKAAHPYEEVAYDVYDLAN